MTYVWNVRPEATREVTTSPQYISFVSSLAINY